ncbi:MAG: DUF4203 domain-containing protein [Vicinamibacterales bacterium]
MLPLSYQMPAAVVLVVCGLMACVAGYRLLWWVLAAFGFIIGGLAASSILGTGDTAYMAGVFLVGGLAGALIMVAASFIGVALVGAGLGAASVTLVGAQFGRDPHPYLVVLAAVAGAWLATWLQRYVTIVGTAFAGAWAVLVGALAITGDKAKLAAAAAGDVWVPYPMQPAPGQAWVPWVWLLLGIAGVLIQLYVTGGQGGRVVKSRKK